MKGVNSVVEVGSLVRDAELKYTNSGTAICTFSLAVNGSEKQGDAYVDRPDFFDVTVFGRLGEALHKYLTKGQQIAMSGRLRQDRWEKDGQKHSRIGIIAESIQLLGSKSDATAPAGEFSAPEPTGSAFTDDVPF